MTPWLWLLASLFEIGMAACLSRHLLDRARGRKRLAVWLALTIAVAAAPAMVPGQHSALRFLSALVSIAVLVALYDVFQTPEITRETGRWQYLVDFVNPLWLVWRRPPPDVPREDDERSVYFYAPAFFATAALLTWVFSISWARFPFVLEHLAKVPLAVVCVALAANLASVVWRRLGQRGLVPMGNFVFARNAAEFWRNWNRPAQHFLSQYVFVPAGGPRHPVRAILATFFVSGLIHEYVLGIAAGRLLGTQSLFFMLQGMAVVISRCRRLPTLPRSLAITLTLAFNLASSWLFFQGVDSIAPFYADR